MLYEFVRVFYSDNGTLTDLSIDNQEDGKTVRANLVAAEDYIYIFKYYPFNNLFIQVDTANDETATLNFEYWNGRGWQAMVDLLDGTLASGKTIARSGIVQYSPDPNYKWNYVNDTSKSGAPTETSSLKLFYMYPMRISTSGDLKATAKIKTISYAFTTSQQLSRLCIEINKFLPAFGTGKTNWETEIMTASLHVVKDLKSKGMIVAEGNILRMDDVSLATDYRTLALIYASLGASQDKARDYWERKYTEVLNNARYTFDNDEDAFVDRNELSNTVQTLVR